MIGEQCEMEMNSIVITAEAWYQDLRRTLDNGWRSGI